MRVIKLLILLIFGIGNVFGQEDFKPDFFPPAPTSGRFEIYGNNSIDLFSGAHQINIPLYNFSNKVKDIPISLNYSSNGIRVDEMESSLGLVWNLNAGGNISRLIKDHSDEELKGFEHLGFDLNNLSSPHTLDPFTLNFIQYIVDEEVDSESDVFSFQTMDFRGNFVINRMSGEILVFPKSNLKIELLPNNENDFEFLITDQNGIKYYYTEKEKISNSSSNIRFNSRFRMSTLYLTKISKDNNTVYFKYRPMNYFYTSAQSQTLSYTPYMQYNCDGSYFSFFQIGDEIYHNQNVKGQLIDSIYTNNPKDGYIKFDYYTGVTGKIDLLKKISITDYYENVIKYFNFSYFENSKQRVFLKSIESRDNYKYSFSYENINEFPSRLSYSQDHWGYFNNKTNYTLIPDDLSHYGVYLDFQGANRNPDSLYITTGLLKSIKFPTKGSEEIEYEPNYKLSTVPVNINNNQTVVAESNFNQRNEYNEFIFESNVNQEVVLKLESNFGSLCGSEAEIPGRHDGSIKVFNLTTQMYVQTYNYTYLGQIHYINNQYPYSVHIEDSEPLQTIYFRANMGNSYRIEVNTNTKCTKVRCVVNYISENGTELKKELVGGVRIKSLKTIDSLNSIAEYKRFHYKSIFNQGAQSIYPSLNPHYVKKSITEESCGSLPNDGNTIDFLTKEIMNITSSSYINLFHPEINKTSFYKYVTISYGNDDFINGGEVYEFIPSMHADGRIFFGTGVKQKIVSNTAWDQGKLRKMISFNSNFDTLRSEVYHYKKDNRFEDFNLNYYTEKKYEPAFGSNLNYECKAEDLTRFREYKYCSRDHNHWWNLLTGNCFTGNMVTRIIYHPCYGKTVGHIVTNLSHLDHAEVIEYKNISHWHYLEKKETTDYYEEGNVVKTENYEYGNLNHLQVTKVSKNTSIGNEEQLFYYPHELLEQGVQTSEMQQLIDENRIGSPVKTESLHNNVISASSITKFDEFTVGDSNLLLPSESFSAKGSEDIENFNEEHRSISYDRYDDKGNVLQYTIENATPVSIIWGYNGKYPVAKIEGLSYNDIPQNIRNSISNASNLDNSSCMGYSGCNEATLRNHQKSLRAYLVDAMITTYTYDPLVGVTSITPPNGQTAYYEYDGFGRLKSVKDEAGNIVQDIQYHYRSQE